MLIGVIGKLQNHSWKVYKNVINAKIKIKETEMLLPQQNGQQLDPIVVQPLL